MGKYECYVCNDTMDFSKFGNGECSYCTDNNISDCSWNGEYVCIHCREKTICAKYFNTRATEQNKTLKEKYFNDIEKLKNENSFKYMESNREVEGARKESILTLYLQYENNLLLKKLIETIKNI